MSKQDGVLTQVNVLRRTFLASEVKTLFSKPIKLLDGQADYVHVPLMALFIKSGAAFTGAASAGNVEIEWLNSPTFTNAIAQTAGFLDTAGENGRLQTPANSMAIGQASTELGGKGLRIVLSLADLTAGAGSDCYLTLVYLTVPCAVATF